MTLKRLIDTIGVIAINDKLVNYSAAGPSVYELNDATIKNYPVIFVTPTGTQDIFDNYTTYELVVFYIDRLLEGNYNAIDVQSAAVEVLKNILKKVGNENGVVEVSDYTITVFIEQERFKDRCTGAYANVRISVVNDSTCVDEQKDYWNEPGTEKYLRMIAPTNDTLSNDIMWLYCRWETSEPSTHVRVLRVMDNYIETIIDADYTDTYFVLIDLPKPQDTAINYEIHLENDGGFADAYLTHLPNYFLNFVNTSVDELAWNVGTYNVKWETNLSEVRWSLKRNGIEMQTGITTNGDNVFVTIPDNTDNENAGYTFTAGNVDGGFTRQLSFTQRYYTYWLTQLTHPFIDNLSSGVSVEFDTNAPEILFEFYWDGSNGTTYAPDFTWRSGMEKVVFVPQPPVGVVTTSGATQNYGAWARAFANGNQINGVSVRGLKPFFWFETEDYQVIPASTTSLTITFVSVYDDNTVLRATNCDVVDSGYSYVTLAFEANTGTSPVAMEISAYGTGMETLGTLHWTQAGVNAYFNITTPSGQTVPAAATSFTINYETNLVPPFPYTYVSPFGTSTGNSWNSSSLTINFRVNDSDEVRERTVTIGGETISWNQDAAPKTYPYDPERQILDNPSANQIFYRSSDGQALPYGVMAGRALDMDNNEMWATSNVYDSNLGYGIVTFPRDIRTTNAVVENKGKLVEVVWPEGMLSINNFDVNTEGNPSIKSITLPSTLRTINALAFYNESIPYINLPIGLRKVGTLNALQRNSFYGNVDNLQILYAGTVTQWNNLAKASDWLYQKRSGQVVHCTDGDVQV